MKLFDYIFYRVCDFYKRKKDSVAEVTSSLIVSLIQFFTILDLLILVRIVWEYRIPNNFTTYWFLPIIIIIPIVNWRKYVKPKMYREYRKKWKDEYVKNKTLKGLLIVLYIVFSLLIPVLYGLIRQNIMGGKSFIG